MGISKIRMSLHQFLYLVALNSIGGIIYKFRAPERWFPGWLDTLGNSHQIMHILVVFGTICYWRGLINLLSRLEDVGITRCGE
jgi:adiponectin receptor